jgi:hypothetical protein
MSTTFYAKADGSNADAGSPTDMLSPTTKAFLYFLKANPGAVYPHVMLEFQWGVLNKCVIEMCSTRGIQFVKGFPKNWTNKEMVDGLITKVVESFPKALYPEFNHKFTEVIGDMTKFDDVLKDRYELQAIKLKDEI